MLRTPIRTALVSLAAALTVVSDGGSDHRLEPGRRGTPVRRRTSRGRVGRLLRRADRSTVFATAGHCGADGTRVEVTLNSKLDDSWTLVKETLEVDAARRSDLAVVILDAAAGVTPADAAKGQLGGLAQAQGRHHERRLRLFRSGRGRKLGL